MKQVILKTAAGLVIAASSVALVTAIAAHSPETITRATSVASILGLGSVGLFFVGLVYPKDS